MQTVFFTIVCTKQEVWKPPDPSSQQAVEIMLDLGFQCETHQKLLEEMRKASESTWTMLMLAASYLELTKLIAKSKAFI